MQILVVTPVPTHPTTHGNRARVRTVVEALQAAGHTVHMVYLGFEPLSARDEAAMRAGVSTLRGVDPPWMQGAPQPRPGPSGGRHYGLDDWAFASGRAAVADYCSRWCIDAVWVNYVWCSFALPELPDDIYRIIDTHDIFADRHKKLASEGIERSFFSTSVGEEDRGLRRAHAVIAIQDAEADQLTKRLNDKVHLIGHLLDQAPPATPPPLKRARALRVGYMASDNPVNVRAMGALLAATKHFGEAATALDFILAGPICDHPVTQGSRLTRLGVVDDPAEFYRSVDVVINPHIGGTGLKIKSIEAMQAGLPLIATRDAMVGIASAHMWHQLADPGAVLEAAIKLATEPARLTALAMASRTVVKQYRGAQFDALAGLLAAVQAQRGEHAA